MRASDVFVSVHIDENALEPTSPYCILHIILYVWNKINIIFMELDYFAKFLSFPKSHNLNFIYININWLRDRFLEKLFIDYLWEKSFTKSALMKSKRWYTEKNPRFASPREFREYQTCMTSMLFYIYRIIWTKTNNDEKQHEECA